MGPLHNVLLTFKLPKWKQQEADTKVSPQISRNSKKPLWNWKELTLLLHIVCRKSCQFYSLLCEVFNWDRYLCLSKMIPIIVKVVRQNIPLPSSVWQKPLHCRVDTGLFHMAPFLCIACVAGAGAEVNTVEMESLDGYVLCNCLCFPFHAGGSTLVQ